MALYALNRPGTVTFTVVNEDGTPTAPASAPTVTVVDASGTTVATGTATAGTGTGVYTYALPNAVRQALGVYQVTFGYTVSGQASTSVEVAEVVGDLLFDVAELRATYPDLENANRYTAAAIRAARDEATERLETAAQVAFAQRRTLQVLNGDDTYRLVLPHVMVTEVHACSIYGEDTGTDLVDDTFDGTELADVEIDADAGVLVRQDDRWPVGFRNVVVVYDHGYEHPPAAVKRAAMRLAVEALIPSGMPSRALSQSTDLGEIRFSTANPEAGRPTGDPEVDAVIALYGRRRPGVG